MNAPRTPRVRRRHHVYVVELDDRVWNSARFRRSNPGWQLGRPFVYVGMTGLDPDLRFDRHKAGVQANRYARDYGQRLLPALYEAWNPMASEVARQNEVALAVKLLRGAHPDDREGRARILREAQAMARVAHPNVVSVYEVGELDGQVFIAMEFVEGATLRQWQHAKGRSWEDILVTYLAAGDGLWAAHQAGLVHRVQFHAALSIGRPAREMPSMPAA